MLSENWKKLLGIANDKDASAIDRIDLGSYVLSLYYLAGRSSATSFRVHPLSYWTTVRDRKDRADDFQLINNPSEFCRIYPIQLQKEKEREEEEAKERKQQKHKQIAELREIAPNLISSILALEAERQERNRLRSIKRFMEIRRPPLSSELKPVEDWWQQIKASSGNYACCGVVLALPSDAYLIQYLEDFGGELDLLSGKSCLIIVLTNHEFKLGELRTKGIAPAIPDHIWNGYCLEVAKLLGIGYDDFPCFVVFDTVESDAFVAISLKGLDQAQISERMRNVFSIVQEAIQNKRNPTKSLNRSEKLRNVKKSGESVMRRMTAFTSKTLEAIISAAVSAAFK